MMMVALSLVTGIVADFIQTPTDIADFGRLDVENNLGGEYKEKLIEEGERSAQREANDQEVSWGSSFTMGKRLIGMFTRGLSPFPIGTPDMYNTEIEKLFIWGILLFKLFLYYIIILFAYQLYKNRSTG